MTDDVFEKLNRARRGWINDQLRALESRRGELEAERNCGVYELRSAHSQNLHIPGALRRTWWRQFWGLTPRFVERTCGLVEVRFTADSIGIRVEVQTVGFANTRAAQEAKGVLISRTGKVDYRFTFDWNGYAAFRISRQPEVVGDLDEFHVHFLALLRQPLPAEA